MYNTHLTSNNIVLTCGDSVRSIAQTFLNSKSLIHFSYVRQYPDSSEFCLTTHPQMVADYFEHQFYKKTLFDKAAKTRHATALLWAGLGPADQVLMQYAKQAHGLDNGIVLTKMKDNIFEHFYFASNPENNTINNYYMAHLDELYNFIFYFKEKAKPLIQKAYQQRIFVQDILQTSASIDINNYPERRASIFLEDIEFKKLYIDHQLKHYLSKREVQCLVGLAKGQSMKEIAKLLNLETETIIFYLKNIKSKLAISSKTELIQFYHSLF